MVIGGICEVDKSINKNHNLPRVCGVFVEYTFRIRNLKPKNLCTPCNYVKVKK